MTFNEFREVSNRRGWKFRVIIDEPVRNIKYIHPLKQKEVAAVVQLAQSSSLVKKIIVFGSSITDKCFFTSDLDLCIDWTIDCFDEDGIIIPEVGLFLNKISRITEGNVDIMHMRYLDGTVVKKDALNGVVVYERGD